MILFLELVPKRMASDFRRPFVVSGVGGAGSSTHAGWQVRTKRQRTARDARAAAFRRCELSWSRELAFERPECGKSDDSVKNSRGRTWVGDDSLRDPAVGCVPPPEYLRGLREGRPSLRRGISPARLVLGVRGQRQGLWRAIFGQNSPSWRKSSTSVDWTSRWS